MAAISSLACLLWKELRLQLTNSSAHRRTERIFDTPLLTRQNSKPKQQNSKPSIVPSLCGLSIDDLPLEKVDVYKYLGVYLTSDLCWSVHIDKICAKSEKLVGMFHCRFFSSMDSESCRLLYKSYIRPHLEYACQVWDPHIKKRY